MERITPLSTCLPKSARTPFTTPLGPAYRVDIEEGRAPGENDPLQQGTHSESAGPGEGRGMDIPTDRGPSNLFPDREWVRVVCQPLTVRITKMVVVLLLQQDSP